MTHRRATALGMVGLALWSTTSGTARGLIEPLQPCTFVALTCGGGGLVLLVVQLVRHGGFRAVTRIPASFLLAGGATFVAYHTTYSLAFGLAPTREVVLQLNLVNYLWPPLTLILSVRLLQRRANWTLLSLGGSIGFMGAAWATLEGFDPEALVRAVSENGPAFLLMFVAALSWALNGNLEQKHARDGAPNGAPLFLCATGAVAAVASVAAGETPQWELASVPELIYVALGPTGLGYLLFEIGMKQGNSKLLASAAFALPITSTAFACLWLDVAAHPGLLGGCALSSAGAFLCNAGLRARQEPGAGEGQGSPPRRDHSKP